MYSVPAWARVGQPERIADKRKLIKDETDEDLSEIFENQILTNRDHFSVRLWPADLIACLRNTQAPRAAGGGANSARLQRRVHRRQYVVDAARRVFQQ
jgi:hypothetical protein